MDYSHVFGSVFGELTVKAHAGEKDRLICQCSCGREKTARLSHLRAGTVKSCGCLLVRRPKEVHGTYLASRTLEYKTWDSMIRRCADPGHHAFANYGARGITVCERWLGARGFGNFLDDLGPKPHAGASLDRIDNSAGYSPENCRWTSIKTQSNNRRTNLMLTSKGETRSLKQWSELLNIGRTTIQARLALGWSVDAALHTPIRPKAGSRQFA